MNLSRQLEAEYRTERYNEYARISRNVAAAGGLLVLALWIRDLLQDAGGAQETLALRLIMAGSAFAYAAAIHLRTRRALVLGAGYACVFVVEFSILALWTRLDAPPSASFPGFLYIYLILPVILLPFSFRESLGAIVFVPLIPNVQVLAGMAPGLPVLAFNAMIWPACAIAIYANGQYDRLLRRLFASQGRLKELATRDELTGLGNRRFVMERGAELLKLARRHNRSLAVLMLDLDHFKAVNDRYGHAAGDDVLRFIGVAMTLQLRATDVAGRTGGEEFAMVLPETGLQDALATAERIRLAIAATPVPTDESPAPIPVTVSIGVAALDASGGSLDDLLSRADGALYQAKRAGRNRVCAEQDPDGDGGTGLATGTDRPRR
ncbi:MAG TPA: GGDEF domain-containing protein [Burkholderiales bacterium]|nr:GGDEF domain-containing protein [Burkholderiales bacterium]